MSKIIGVNKSRRDFLTHVLGLFLSISQRINFLQLARYSNQYVESTCRLQFEAYFDFATTNQQYIRQKGSGHYVLSFDLSYLKKSGKATDGVGKYWSGTAQRPLWGLEAGLLSVIDIDNHTAFHVDVFQTPAKAERQDKDITLMDHYTQTILWSAQQVEALSRYLVVDAYFAKQEFIDRIERNTTLRIISRLRSDANCCYLYEGPQRKGRGAPRKYAGKIDWQAPDLTRFTLLVSEATFQLYTARAYCKFLKRIIQLAFSQYLDEQGKVKSYTICFSTDLSLSAPCILQYYQARFQQEFLIRDAKQFTGLQDCQARSVNKLEFHWNLALTSVNIAKIEHWLTKPKEHRGAFSMSSIKTLYHNQLLLDRLFDMLPESTQLIKNDPNVKELYSFGCIAA